MSSPTTAPPQPPQPVPQSTQSNSPPAQPGYYPQTKEKLEENLRAVKLHSQALQRQIVESERFYFQECSQHNVMKGWDSYTQENPKQSSKVSKNEQLHPFSQTVYYLHSDSIRFNDNLESYKSQPTIQWVSHKGGSSAPSAGPQHSSNSNFAHNQQIPSQHAQPQHNPSQQAMQAQNAHIQPNNYVHSGATPGGPVKRSYG
jgi:hypothetical protein